MASSQDTTSTTPLMPTKGEQAAATPPKARKIIPAKAAAHGVASTSIQDACRLAPISLRPSAQTGFFNYELVANGSRKRRVPADHHHEPEEAQLRGPKRHKLDVTSQEDYNTIERFTRVNELKAKLETSEKSKAAGDAEIAELKKQAEADRQTATSQYEKLLAQHQQLQLELQAERARGEQAKQTSDADVAGLQDQLASQRDAARSEITSRDATIQQLQGELSTARSVGEGAFTAKNSEVADLKQQLESAGHMAARQKKEADAAIEQLKQELSNMRSVGEEAFKAKNKEVVGLQQELETASQKAALEKKGADERIQQLTEEITAERSGREQAIQEKEAEQAKYTGVMRRYIDDLHHVDASQRDLIESCRHFQAKLDTERTGRASDMEAAQEKINKLQEHLEVVKEQENLNHKSWMAEHQKAYDANKARERAEYRMEKLEAKLQETTKYLEHALWELQRSQAEAARLSKDLKPTTNDMNNLANMFGQQLGTAPNGQSGSG